MASTNYPFGVSSAGINGHGQGSFSGTATRIPQQPLRYPTFSGDDPEARPAGLGDRFSGRSVVRHVASYLRHRRWLWSFTDTGTFRDMKVAGDRSSDRGGGGIAGASPRFAPSWPQVAQQIVNTLARARRADGFVMVELRKTEALMMKGIRIKLGVVPESQKGETAAGGAGGGSGYMGRPRGTGSGGIAQQRGSMGRLSGDVGDAGVRAGGRGDASGRAEGTASDGRWDGTASGGGGGAPGSDGGRLRHVRLLVQYRVFEVSQERILFSMDLWCAISTCPIRPPTSLYNGDGQHPVLSGKQGCTCPCGMSKSDSVGIIRFARRHGKLSIFFSRFSGLSGMEARRRIPQILEYTNPLACLTRMSYL